LRSRAGGWGGGPYLAQRARKSRASWGKSPSFEGSNDQGAATKSTTKGACPTEGACRGEGQEDKKKGTDSGRRGGEIKGGKKDSGPHTGSPPSPGRNYMTVAETAKKEGFSEKKRGSKKGVPREKGQCKRSEPGSREGLQKVLVVE